MVRSVKYRHPVTVVDEQLAARCLRGHIAVIDDDSEILFALSALLTLEGYACDTYTSAQAYLLGLNSNRPNFPGPRCVLSDIRMPGLDGLELQTRLANRDDTPLLLMSGASSVEDAVLAFRSGALDFLIKPIDAELLLQAIRKGLELSVQRQQWYLRQSDLSMRISQLTGRERDVARRVATGLTNPAIADELGIAVRTVKLHRQRAMEKLGAQSTAELVRIADAGSL
jgi:FixJ family two-component response regulator